MAGIKPFQGIRYNPSQVGSYDDVITPPFDVISPEERELLHSKSPYNYTHLILPSEEGGKDKYAHAAELLAAWLREGVLRQDDEESFYLLEQQFEDQQGRRHTRRGFFNIAKVPEPGEETILGHEQTFRHKIEDRLALTKTCKANFGAVFCTYADPENRLRDFYAPMDTREPDVSATTIDGAHMRLWRVPGDPEVSRFFEDKTLYIADGHHRFKTACVYRDEMREQEKPEGLQPYDYFLMGLVPMEDPGFVVFPAHRALNLPDGAEVSTLLNKLEQWFEVSPTDEDLAQQVQSASGCVIGLAHRDAGRYLLKLRDIDRTELLGDDHGPAWRDLDVSVLHRGILERIMGVPEGTEFVYEPDPGKTLDLVKSGEKEAAFLLKATSPQQIKACADAREFMPQKSTYLFPKLPSGAVFYHHAS